jgi:hypothetical protein
MSTCDRKLGPECTNNVFNKFTTTVLRPSTTPEFLSRSPGSPVSEQSPADGAITLQHSKGAPCRLWSRCSAPEQTEEILHTSRSKVSCLLQICSTILRASPVVLYRKPESRKRWNCSGQQGRSLYSSFIYRLKQGFLGVLECFASERHSGLGERGSHDYRVTGFKVDWGCSNENPCAAYPIIELQLSRS